MDPAWITAFATVIYTIGTFGLWWTTRKNVKGVHESLELARDAFKLNFLITIQEADEVRRKHIVGSPFLTKDLLKRVFPELYESLITQYGKFEQKQK
jgi:hypothetical protein